MGVIRCGEDPGRYNNVGQLGGKGINLHRLYNAAQNSEWYNVPRFFIIPKDCASGHVSRGFDDNETVEKYFDELRKPVAVRSSSPLEDGTTATFAGMFKSVLGVNDYKGLVYHAFEDVLLSGYSRNVERHAERVGVEHDPRMAIIVQEQVVNPDYYGIIKINGDLITINSICEGEEFNHETEWGDMIKRYSPHRLEGLPTDYIAEGHTYHICEAALNAMNDLELDGVVQIEFCFSLGKPVDFVQIRRLPDVDPLLDALGLIVPEEVPEGAPYFKSKVCNGIPGEDVLPAYVTVTPHAAEMILVAARRRGRIDEESRIFHNRDFYEMCRLIEVEMLLREKFKLGRRLWEEGDALFDRYALVCDRLDEVNDVHDVMNHATPNKGAIIAVSDMRGDSHAMTVARDLKIIGMGGTDDLFEAQSFLHQVETGDLIYIKSDGREGIAWLEKRRDSNPYGPREEVDITFFDIIL